MKSPSPWNHPEITQITLKSPWNHYEITLKSPWNHREITMKYTWPHHHVHLPPPETRQTSLVLIAFSVAGVRLGFRQWWFPNAWYDSGMHLMIVYDLMHMRPCIDVLLWWFDWVLMGFYGVIMGNYWMFIGFLNDFDRPLWSLMFFDVDWILWDVYGCLIGFYTSSTAQGSGGSFRIGNL